MEGLRDYFRGWLLDDDALQYTQEEMENVEPDFIIKEITDKAVDLYEKREEEFGEEIMRELERVVLLKNVDTKDVYKRQVV